MISFAIDFKSIKSNNTNMHQENIIELYDIVKIYALAYA